MVAETEPPITTPKIVCRLGSWKTGRCPFKSCEMADACTAPVPDNDNDPGQSGAPASPCPFPYRVLP